MMRGGNGVQSPSLATLSPRDLLWARHVILQVYLLGQIHVGREHLEDQAFFATAFIGKFTCEHTHEP